ncbi:DUF3276 family protein [Carboxylicivirga caseinilyticus]|uniref:DUF3276 family protein n=1 Tax=Carboxylicivirga caseinilyticus TaxID=3417572 RepID=UPI003D353AA3
MNTEIFITFGAYNMFPKRKNTMEGFDKKEEIEKNDREEIFSKAVRAGKRTYFFDVKATRKEDYYLTVTESKKRYDQDGRYHFEKHKVFLYKEDFDKFIEGLQETIDFIKKNQNFDLTEKEEVYEEAIASNEYTNVEFEDLHE